MENKSKLMVGDMIRRLRKKNNITQDRLAEYLGVTPQAVSRWESGVCYPDLNSLPPIADYFGVSMDVLLGYNGNRRNARVEEYIAATEKLLDRDRITDALELLRGVVDCVKPNLILAVDALAARSCARLASTVQISDAGISPGSGVGNHRAPLTKETLGAPVIAMGVPTVVNSATLVYDALRQAGIEEIGESLQSVLESGKSFFVSPKDSDVITEEVARLLADAIREAFTGI